MAEGLPSLIRDIYQRIIRGESARATALTSAPIFSPIPSRVVDASAVSLCQVTAQQSTHHGKPGTKDQEDDAGCYGAPEVWDKEDENSRIHQNGQHNS